MRSTVMLSIVSTVSPVESGYTRSLHTSEIFDYIQRRRINHITTERKEFRALQSWDSLRLDQIEISETLRHVDGTSVFRMTYN